MSSSTKSKSKGSGHKGSGSGSKKNKDGDKGRGNDKGGAPPEDYRPYRWACMYYQYEDCDHHHVSAPNTACTNCYSLGRYGDEIP